MHLYYSGREDEEEEMDETVEGHDLRENFPRLEQSGEEETRETEDDVKEHNVGKR